MPGCKRQIRMAKNAGIRGNKQWRGMAVQSGLPIIPLNRCRGGIPEPGSGTSQPDAEVHTVEAGGLQSRYEINGAGPGERDRPGGNAIARLAAEQPRDHVRRPLRLHDDVGGVDLRPPQPDSPWVGSHRPWWRVWN